MGSGGCEGGSADAFAGKPAPTESGGVHSNRVHHKITVGACLQAIAVGQATWILNGLTPSRAGSLPQGLGVDPGYSVHPDPLWERGLPAMAVGQPTEMLNVPTPSRASPLPQELGCRSRYLLHPEPLWERGLPAMAVDQPTEMLNVPTPSRASSLPQGLGVDRDIQFIPIPQLPSRLWGYSVIFEKLR